jgi:hypothetical protein
MNPIEGTEIIFFEDGRWWNKNSDGVVVPTSTHEYHMRYKLRNSLVVVEDEDDKFITGLNGDAFTVVVDKEMVGRPGLKTYKFTKEWMSLTDYLKLRKMTAAFCIMSKGFFIPPK